MNCDRLDGVAWSRGLFRGPPVSRCGLRPLIAALVAIAPSIAPAQTAASLWLVENKRVASYNADTGGELSSIATHAQRRALAVDKVRGHIWSLGGGTLLRHDQAGNAELTVDLPAGGGNSNVQLAVSEASGDVWAAFGSSAWIVSSGGDVLRTLSLPDAAIGVALATDGTRAWIATSSEILGFDGTGNAGGVVNLPGKQNIADIAIEPVSGHLWIADKKDIVVANAFGDVVHAWRQSVEFLSSGANGRVWAADKKRLYLFDSEGETLASFSNQQPGSVVDLEASSSDGSVWLASQQWIYRYSASGATTQQIATNGSGGPGRIWDIALYSQAEAQTPTLVFLAPESGVITSNPRPSLQFGFEASPDSVDASGITISSEGTPLSVNCALNDVDLLIDCDLAEDLHEGQVTLVATLASNAGTVSDPAEVTFLVDTVAPTLAYLEPQPGSYLNETSLSIRLSTADAGSGIENSTLVLTANGNEVSANCEFENDEAGCLLSGLSVEGAVELGAQIADVAGNVSDVAGLTIVLDRTPPVINIVSPQDGAFSRSPVLSVDLSIVDELSGVDSSTLRVASDRQPEPFDCVVTGASAECTPAFPLAEGPHSLAAAVSDQAGNLSQEISVAVVIDTTAPVLAIVNPASGDAVNTATPSINLEYSDALSGIVPSSLSVQLVGLALEADCVTGNSGATCSFPGALPEGQHQLAAQILDAAGNASGLVSRQFLVDLTPPVLSFVTPSGGFLSPNTDALRLNVGDNLSGVDPATLTVASPVTGPLNCEIDQSLAVCSIANGLADGAYEFDAEIFDLAGNASAVATLAFTVDSSAPSIGLISPAAGAWNTVPRPVISLAFEEQGGEIDTASLEVQLGDAPAPLDCSVEQEGAMCTPFQDLPNGASSFQVRVSDTAGNQSDWLAFTVRVDQALPTLEILEPQPGAFENQPSFSARVAAADDGSGIDESTFVFRVNGALVSSNCEFAGGEAVCVVSGLAAEGDVSLQAQVADIAGNQSETASRTIVFDQTPPDVSVVAPASGTFTRNVTPTVILELSDNLSGIELSTLSVSSNAGSQPFTCEVTGLSAECTPTAPLPEGANSITATVRDRADNESSEVSVALTVDVSAPLLSILQPTTGEALNTSTPVVDLSYSDALSGVIPGSLSLQLDGAPQPTECTSNSAGASCTFVSPLAEGQHLAAAEVLDAAGNSSGVVEVRFLVDVTAPTVNFVSPAAGYINPTTSEIHLSVNDNLSGINPNTLSVESAATGILACDIEQTAAVCVIDNALTDGDYEFRARVTDRAGNVSPSAVLNVSVDASAPSIEWVSPLQGAWSNDLRPSFVVAFDEQGSSIDASTLEIEVGGQLTQFDCAVDQIGAECHPRQDLDEGINSVRVRVSDLAGNFSEWLEFSLQVDQTPPALTFVSPDAGSSIPESAPEILIEIADPQSGIDASTLAVQAVGLPTHFFCTPNASGASCLPGQPLPEGLVNLSATVSDVAGNASAPADLEFTVDVTPPTLLVESPTSGETTFTAQVTLVGRVSELGELALDGEPVYLAPDLAFHISVDLTFGSNEMTLSLVDLAGNEGSITHIVERIRSEPSITSEPPTQVTVGDAYHYAVEVSDPDPDDVVTFRLLQAPLEMEVDASGLLTWEPGASDVGLHLIRLEAVDENGDQDEQVWELEVAFSNDAPSISSQPSTLIREESQYLYQVVATDPDGDDIEYVLEDGPPGMTIDPSTGLVQWLASGPDFVQRTELNPQCRVQTDSNLLANDSSVAWNLPAAGYDFGTPVVGRVVDTSGDGVVDLNDVPVVITATSALTAINGLTGATIWSQFTGPGSLGPAIADADLDGEMEIYVYSGHSGILIAYNGDGSEKWRNSNLPSWASVTNRAIIHVADLDGDGDGEIAVAGAVVDSDGSLLWSRGTFAKGALAVDLDLDGESEIIFDHSIYNIRGELQFSLPRHGISSSLAIGGLDGDPFPEIITVEDSRFTQVFEHDGTQKWSASVPHANGHVVPFVADISGDGNTEIVVTLSKRGAGQTGSVIAYYSSGGTAWLIEPGDSLAGAVFDFTGSGLAETFVHSHTRFDWYSAADGREVVRLPNFDSPATPAISVVADVDGDGFAEIIASHRDRGMVVLKSASNQWPKTRPIWNQHHFHSDSIDDWGRLRPTAGRDWKRTDRFRANDEFGDHLRADLVIQSIDAADESRTRFHVSVRNRGTSALGGAIALFDGPSSGGLEIGSASVPLVPADKTVVVEVDAPAGVTSETVSGVVSSDAANECHTANNAGTARWVTVVANDGNGGQARQQFLINVRYGNSPPTLDVPSNVEVMQFDRLNLTAVAVDEDPFDAVNVRLIQAPDGMKVDARSGLITWTPKSGDVGTHGVTITAQDMAGALTFREFTVEVTPEIVGLSPEITSTPPISVIEGQSLDYQVLAQDPNPKPTVLNYELEVAPPYARIDKASGELAWYANPAYVESVSELDSSCVMGDLSPRAVRLDGGSLVGTIHSRGEAFAPGLSVDASFVAFEDSGKTSVLATQQIDVPGPGQTVVVTHPAPAQLAGIVALVVDPSGGVEECHEDNNAAYAAVFGIKVTSEYGLSATQRFSVNILDQSEAPALTSTAPLSVIAGSHLRTEAIAIDRDLGDRVVYSIRGAPVGMQIDALSGLLSWETQASDAGAYAFDVVATDLAGNESIETVTLEVSAVAGAPRFVSVPAPSAKEGDTYQYAARALSANPAHQLIYEVASGPESADQDALSGALALAPRHEPVSLTPHALCYEPGTESLSLRVKWRAGAADANSPVVGPLTDTNGDGILDREDRTRIVTLTESFGSGSIIARDGATGDSLWNFNQFGFRGAGLSLVDLERDGSPEIIALTSDFRIAALDASGNLKWVSEAGEQPSPLREAPSVHVADLDGDGLPEIVGLNLVLRNDGSTLTRLGSSYEHWVVADLDLDGTKEIIGGGTVYDRFGGILQVLHDGGNAVVGGFDLDPYPEILIYRDTPRSEAILFEHDGAIIWSYGQFGGGGLRTVADIDGDGFPELASGDKFDIRAMSHTGFLHWNRKEGIQDSSGFTGATAFDFLSDGSAEVLHNDHSRLRILDGRTGNSQIEQFNGSYTQGEYALVVDLDNDDHAELLIYSGGWVVYEVEDDRWPSTRNVWNQYHYIPDSIEDDLTLSVETNYWTYSDLVQANPSFAPDPLPDLVTGSTGVVPGTNTIRAEILNRGQRSSEVTNVQLVANGTVWGDASLGSIPPGSRRAVEFAVSDWSELGDKYSIVIDSGESVIECEERNNTLYADLLAIQVSDPNALSDRQHFSVFVENVADAPHITSTADTEIAIGGEFRYRPVVADADIGDAHYFELLESPSAMGMHPRTGELRWVPRIGDEGLHSVRIRVVDLDGLADEQSFEISAFLQSPNQQPEFASDALTQARVGWRYSYGPAATDPEGSPLAWRLEEAPVGMRIDRVAGLVTWTPQATGNYTVVISATDTAGVSATQGYTLRVFDTLANTFPEITSTPQVFAYVHESYQYPVSAIDADADTLRYSLEMAPSGLEIDPSSGLVSWVPGSEQRGSHQVAISVSDGRGAGDSQQFEIFVQERPTNLPPRFTSTPPTIGAASDAYRYAISAFDPEGDAISFDLIQSPPGMAFLPGLSTLQWHPAASDNGTHDVAVAARDTFGNESVQTFSIRIALSNPNSAPALASIPDSRARIGEVYSYQVLAQDQDGDVLRFDLIDGPPGMSLEGSARDTVTWSPTMDDQGTRPYSVLVSDQFGGSITFTVELDVFANSAPTIESSAVTEAVVGANYAYAVVATDADGDALEYMLPSAPQGMAIDAQSGEIAWIPQADQLGSHDVQVQVRDGYGGVAEQAFVVEVRTASGNQAPQITSYPQARAKVGHDYAYVVAASDPNGDALSYTLVNGPASMSMSTEGFLQWTPAQSGTESVRLRVDDGDLFVEQFWTIEVLPESARLGLSVNASPQPADISETITLTIALENAVGAVSLSGDIAGQPVVFDADGVATTTFDQPGAYQLDVTATDTTDSASISHTLLVRDPDDTVAPFVDLLTPTENLRLTAPGEVVATVSADDLLYWNLHLVAGEPGAVPILLATGTDSVAEQPIGEIDPTLMTNGAYRLVLEAVDDGGNLAIAERAFHVDGAMKLGHFTVTFEDVSLPVAGLPITITRTYDSRRRNEALDFGHGWSVGYETVRVQEGKTTGFGWQLITENSGSFPTTCVRPVGGDRLVTVTMPDGELERFRAVADPECVPLGAQVNVQLRYEALEDTDSTLDQTDYGLLRLINGHLADPETPATPVDPDRYRLTTREGLIYDLHQGFTLEVLTDVNDNTVTFSSAGVIHSAGASIEFERDPLGRITAMLLPDGTRTEYIYDAEGNLQAAFDQVENATTFTYLADHYLEEIRDPLGQRAVRNEYSPEGRLVAQVDAQGNRIEYTHDIEGRTQTIRDRRGNPSVYVFNDRGDVVAQTNALGETTLHSYDEFGYELSRTNPLGEVTTWTYDARGNTLSEENALGETTSYTYSEFNQLLTTTAADGTLSSQAYDNRLGRAGLLTDLSDGLGQTTSFGYRSDGVLTSVQDANGDAISYVSSILGYPQRELHPNGREIDFETDALGRVLTETTTRTLANGSQRSLITRYTYDEKGRQTSVTDPLGHVSRTEYDGNDQVIAEIDPLGRRTEYEYDSRGQRILTRFPDGTTELPGDDATAPVKAPRIWPKISLSISSPGIAPQLIATNG